MAGQADCIRLSSSRKRSGGVSHLTRGIPFRRLSLVRQCMPNIEHESCSIFTGYVTGEAFNISGEIFVGWPASRLRVENHDS